MAQREREISNLNNRISASNQRPGSERPLRVRALFAALTAGISVVCIVPFGPGTSHARADSPQKPKGRVVEKEGPPAGSGKPVPPSAQAGSALKAYSQTLPGSVVKVDMMPIPSGFLIDAGKMKSVKPFWIASTEMTWEAYDVFLASGPPSPAYDQTAFPVDAIARPSKSYILPDLGWGHHGYPAINVSILSVTMYCRWLSAQTGKKYRLPTDTEWEYACRAGASNAKPLAPLLLGKTAWYAANSEGKTHPVGKKLPNAWKLYDMQGNTGEWATDAEGKPVLCGGAFNDKAELLVPTTRRRQTPAWQATDPQLPKSRWWLADGKFIGFRIVCEP